MSFRIRRHHRRTQAFSLFELLIVIGIVGIFGSMALTYMGGLHVEFQEVRDQRNAQEIASIAMGALVAGASFVEPGDMSGTIGNLIEGRSGTQGPFAGRIFRLAGMTQDEVAGAMRFLVWESGAIQYAGGVH